MATGQKNRKFVPGDFAAALSLPLLNLDKRVGRMHNVIIVRPALRSTLNTNTAEAAADCDKMHIIAFLRNR
jgi:hypothetical protein